MPVAAKLTRAICKVDGKDRRINQRFHLTLNDYRSAVVIFQDNLIHRTGPPDALVRRGVYVPPPDGATAMSSLNRGLTRGDQPVDVDELEIEAFTAGSQEIVMPRYFFTTADGTREPDLDGTELPNVASTRVEAIKFAGEELSDDPEVVWDGEDFRVEVSDERGLILFTVLTMAMNSPSTTAP